MNRRILIFLIGFFAIMSTGYAQKKQFKKELVKEVFFELEKEYQIKFSYSDNLIKGVKISVNIEGKTLDAILQEIRSQTNLVFQKVTKRYIIVLDKNEHRKTAICGYLYDMISEAPLQEASIITISKSTGTTSDKEGYFQLASLSSNDTVIVSFVGYRRKMFLVKELLKKPCKEIYLEEYTSVLNDILITNYLASGISKESDGSVEISSKKLGILPGLTEPDVLQSLQLLPGINSPNETASGIHIRGGTPDQNLILFDGIKMYNSAHFFGMISAFNPYITEKITVFRGGVGAKYGNHISGVVDIETKNNIAKKTNGGFGFNWTHVDAFLETKLSDKIGFSFSARRSFTDIFNTNTFSKLSDKVFQNTIIAIDRQQSSSELLSDSNDFYFIDFNSKIIYQPSSKDKITITQLMTKNTLEHLFKFNDDSYKTSDDLEISNNGFSLKWSRDWNEKITQKTSLYFSKYDLKYRFEAEESTPNRDQSREKQNQIKDVNFQTSFDFNKSAKSKYSLGYQYTNSNVFYRFERLDQIFPQFEFTLSESNTNSTHAFFGEYAYNNKDKQSLQLGLRSNYFTLTDKFYIAPRLYLQVMIAPNLWAKGSLEYKQQNISQLLELSTADFGLENQVWALSESSEIPVLRSDQTTLGFVFKKDRWIIDFDVYQKQVVGITSISNGFQTISNNFSEGFNRIKGIDFLIQKRWNNYSSWISYSFNDAKFTFTDINNGNSFAANTDITHNFLWSHNIKAGNYYFSLGWNLRSGIPYTKAIGLNTNSQIIYEDVNASRLPTYHKLDFSTTYSFDLSASKKWRGKIGLSLLNVYNKRNVLQRTYSVQFTNGGTQQVVKKETFSLGFTPNMVFRVMF
jgi:hypothetical protein